jgi:lipoprotein-releasing system permease protein
LNLSFYIARRYLVSKKSNNAINIISWISIIAIAFTTAALVIILSAMNGLTGVVANLYNAIEPDLKITPAHSKFFKVNDALVQKIKGVNGVDKVSLSIFDNALLKCNDKMAIVTVKGVDENFQSITDFDSVITEGTFKLKYKDNYMGVFGRGIANQLQINVNNFVEPISIYSPKRGAAESLNPEENFNTKYISPAGIFALNDDFDFKYVIVDLDLARAIFDCKDEVTSLEIGCTKGANVNEVQEQLEELMGNDFVLKNRYQLNDVLFKTLETEKLWTFIILAFILIISTFNIIGSLTMLIIEKKKDIKTLYNMGANNKLMRNIFMGEGFLITFIGASIGLMLGLGVCLLQLKYHLVKFDEQYVIPYYPIEMQLQDFAWIIILIMLIGFLAALYPVRVFTKADFVHGND